MRTEDRSPAQMICASSGTPQAADISSLVTAATKIGRRQAGGSHDGRQRRALSTAAESSHLRSAVAIPNRCGAAEECSFAAPGIECLPSLLPETNM
jgi:hypothetical protein